MYLAIDLGTTGCRSIIFDDKLNQIGDCYEEYGLITPKDNWVEQEAELWWEMTERTARHAIKNAGISPLDIKSISISSQGITIVPVDENINPLCNAISWLDMRANKQYKYVQDVIGMDRMFEITGKQFEADYTLPKLLWIKDEMPDVWEKAYKFLMPMDFLIAKLTGNCVTDHSMASGTLFYDIKKCDWSHEIIEKIGIPTQKLPTLAWSGEVAGKVTQEVSRELGLSPECVVAVGAQDQKCAALGAGLDKNTMTISLGTAGAITKSWDKIDYNESAKVGWCTYTKPGTWVTEGVINTAGTCLRFVRDLMFEGEDYKVIDEEAKTAIDNGNSVLFYPYLNGPSSPDFYKDSEGVFYGMNLSTKRGNFAAAVMEGIAFQVRILLEEMKAYGNVNRVVLFGGGSKGSLWCQIIADITGLEIMVPSTAEAAGAGAAMLAAKGVGIALDSLSCKKSYKPSDKKDYYEEKYKKYRTIEKKLWQ